MSATSYYQSRQWKEGKSSLFVKTIFGAPSMLVDIRTSRIHIAILFEDQQNNPACDIVENQCALGCSSLHKDHSSSSFSPYEARCRMS